MQYCLKALYNMSVQVVILSLSEVEPGSFISVSRRV